MNKYRVSVVMLAIWAVLTCLYLHMNRMDVSKTNSLLVEARTGIKDIEIATSGGTLNLIKNGGIWSVKGEPAVRLDQNKITALEDTLIHLSASRTVENAAKDFQKYGLSKAGKKVLFRTRSGKSETLMVGSETASKSQYYVRSARRSSVFICEKEDINLFQSDISAYRDRNIIAVDLHTVNSIGFRDIRQEFRLKKVHSGQWQFIAPVKAPVRGDAIKDLLETVFQMRAKDFVTQSTVDLAQYGLDKPSAIVQIGDTQGKVQTLLFGTPNPQKQMMFVKDSGSREIYTISTDSFRPQFFKMGSLLDVAPLSVGIGKIRGITVMELGNTVELARALSPAGEDSFTLSGKRLKTEDFNSFYLNIMALSAAGYDSGNPGASPEISVILKRTDNQNLRADFSKRDPSTFFMSINGEPVPYYVNADKIMLVRKWLQRLQTGS